MPLEKEAVEKETDLAEPTELDLAPGIGRGDGRDEAAGLETGGRLAHEHRGDLTLLLISTTHFFLATHAFSCLNSPHYSKLR